MPGPELQHLDGKVAIVTGGAGGIGQATARLFIDRGAKVMLTDRDGAKLEEAAASLGSPDRCATMVADSTDDGATEAAVAATVERFGGLDILIANAGTEGVLKPLDELSVEDFEHVLRVNVVGIWLAMKHAAPFMKKSGKGAIIALSSVAGIVGLAGMAAYVASKHAVFGLVKVAAEEFGPLNIRVNAVAPGPVDNRMMQSLGEQLGAGNAQGFRSFIESRVPMGRYARNEEIAQLIAFLASDAASYCNGGLYLADGGYAAG